MSNQWKGKEGREGEYGQVSITLPTPILAEVDRRAKRRRLRRSTMIAQLLQTMLEKDPDE